MPDLITDVQNRNLALVEQAGQVEVYDADSADRAGRLLTQVKSVVKSIEDARKQVTKGLDEAKARAMEQQRNAQAPYLEAQQHLEGVLLAFDKAEQERVAREQAEAEAQRAALENEAQRAAEEGRIDDAAALQVQRDTTGAVTKAHRAAGTQARRTWEGEVTDFDAFLKAVAENAMLPSNLLQVNQSALNAYARATDGKMNVPGVTFRQKASIAATARA